MSALQKYFRSAILIDDDIERPVRTGGSVGSGDESYVEPQPGLDTPDETERLAGRGPNAASVTEAFLARDIVCSVVTLPKSESDDPVTRIAQLAHSTDILILDWFIPDDETTTLASLKQIKDQSHNKLVAIAILSEQNRLGIVGRIVEELQLENCDDRYLRHRQLLVMVYNKPTVEVMDPLDPQRIDNYSDLPQHILADLDDSFEGLMPQFAFAGMNAIRNAMPNVLATFGRGLDRGGILHRAMLPPQDDAGHQYCDVLLSEFADALDRAEVAEEWNGQAVEDNLELDGQTNSDQVEKLRDSLSAMDSQRFPRDDPTVCLREVLISGIPDSGSTKAHKNAVQRLVEALPGFTVSNQALASLMCSMPIRRDVPQLGLGMIVQDANAEYLLCVQPRCDSVRIAQERPFPLAPLSIVTKFSFDSGIDAMFEDDLNGYIAVQYTKHPYRLRNPSFKSNPEDVVVAHKTDDVWSFTDANEDSYRAVARLRPEFAAEALHAIAGQLTRIGHDTSEWLRRGGLGTSNAD